MPSRSPRRRLVTLALAVVLAAEGGAMAIASRAAASGASTPGSTAVERPPAGAPQRQPEPLGRADGPGPAARSVATTASAVAATLVPRRPPSARDAVVAPPAAATPIRQQQVASRPAYRGVNHVWIPALGIDRSVHAFPCSRSRPPDNLVYRWGCAGSNNVYLMGHAHSVFRALHDAYVSGRLRKGMEVIYADGRGRVRTYAVAWWKTTRPTTSASWAWAPQSRPSMTLQTCVGANSAFRLMVRLVATG